MITELKTKYSNDAASRQALEDKLKALEGKYKSLEE